MRIKGASAVLSMAVLVATTVRAGNWRQDGMILERTFEAIEADNPAVPAKTGKPSCKMEENCDCPVPGITSRWKAAYCMLREETDDLENAAVQECLARQDPDGVRKLPACEQNMHWKTMICRAAHPAKEVRDCVDDASFVPRFVEEGPGS